MNSYKLRNYRRFVVCVFIILALNVPLIFYICRDLLVRWQTEWFIIHLIIFCEVVLYAEIFLLLRWIVTTQLVISDEYVELFTFKKSHRMMFDDVCSIRYKWNGVCLNSKIGKRLVIRRDFENYEQLKGIIESKLKSIGF